MMKVNLTEHVVEMSLEHISMEYFTNYNFRREFLNYLRVRKGIEAKNGEDPYETQKGLFIK